MTIFAVCELVGMSRTHVLLSIITESQNQQIPFVISLVHSFIPVLVKAPTTHHPITKLCAPHGGTAPPSKVASNAFYFSFLIETYLFTYD